MSECNFCPAGGPPGHRGSCCPQPSTGEAGQLHQRTRAPSRGLGLCRARSGSLADPGVLSPENPGSLIPTSRLFTFSCRERAWWAELLCAWNHRIRSPQSSLPGVPLEGWSRRRWMAQRPHEACGSLNNSSYNRKRPASWHTALGRLILPLSGPSHPTPPTPLPKKERFLTCCKESGRDTLSLRILWSELTKPGSPAHHLPRLTSSIPLKHLSLAKQRGPGVLSGPAAEIAPSSTKGRGGPQCPRANADDHLSQTLSFPSPVLPHLEWSLLSAKMPVYLQEEQEMVCLVVKRTTSNKKYWQRCRDTESSNMAGVCEMVQLHGKQFGSSLKKKKKHRMII